VQLVPPAPPVSNLMEVALMHVVDVSKVAGNHNTGPALLASELLAG
jgi:hypothetical protein